MGHNAVWLRHFSAEKQEQTIAHELCFCSPTVPNIATVLNLLTAQLFVARDVLNIATVVNLLAAVYCARDVFQKQSQLLLQKLYLYFILEKIVWFYIAIVPR